MAESQRRPLEKGSLFKTNNGEFVEVIEYLNKSKVLIEFKDENKYRKWVEKSQVVKGEIKNPYTKSVFARGFIGVGDYRAKQNRKDTKEYIAWSGMFWRCYSESKLEKNPTYVGCEVAEKWYNYQKFCEWYCSRPQYLLNWQLDKDLLSSGSKIYSEETCCLLPGEVNAFLADRSVKSNGLPPGVYWVKREGKYKAQIRDRFYESQRLLGLSNDLDYLFNLYKEAKESQAIYLAEKWKDSLDEIAYEKLKTYTIEWRK